MSVLNVKTAEYAVSHNDDIIKTGSVGSCIVITLYDKEKRIGGLAHAMLPEHNKKTTIGDDKKDNNAKYVTDAIDLLLEGVIKAGGQQNTLEAKLVGGASMFRRLAHEKHSIGHKNTVAARNYLERLGINIQGEDTGGSSGKIAELNLTNGVLEVNTKL